MSKEKRVFKNAFLDVYEIFTKIKKRDKTLLPRLLQSIESYLIIDVISKRIAKEFPDAPIFPIHDSIATTKKYVADVELIMLEELTKAIGYQPKLKPETWDIENMHKDLNNLKLEAMKTSLYLIEHKEMNLVEETQEKYA